MAIGLAGSLARGDYWDGSDLDLNVIIKGELTYAVLLKFKEIEIDIAYFNESQYDNLPYDLVPIYDPRNIINDILMNRDQEVMKYISNIHLAAEEIATAFILLNGEDPTLRRTISRLEKALSKEKENSLYKKYLSLYDMTNNLNRTKFFYNTLNNAYGEIWSILLEKGIGSIRISPESTFQNFIRCRFKPVYNNDERDFIWLTFHEFTFILKYFFKFEELDKTSEDLDKSKLVWINCYKNILDTIPIENIPELYETSNQLMKELIISRSLFE
jgi:predicted nucleotidyltransferase